MRIIGFNLSKISIERSDKPEENLNIKSNIEVKDIIRDSIEITRQEVIKIYFNFTVDYEPNFAKLALSGYLITLPESDEFKKLIKGWKEKKIPDEIRIPLFNFIMNKCNIKALELEDEMALPLHVPMPHLTPEKKQD